MKQHSMGGGSSNGAGSRSNSWRCARMHRSSPSADRAAPGFSPPAVTLFLPSAGWSGPSKSSRKVAMGPDVSNPRARLAELRISQGRFEEAERLLSGIETRPETIRPMVELHVARGELAPAAAMLHRWLRKMGPESVGASRSWRCWSRSRSPGVTSTVPCRRRIRSRHWQTRRK